MTQTSEDPGCPCCGGGEIHYPKDLNLHGFDECGECGCLWNEELRLGDSKAEIYNLKKQFYELESRVDHVSEIARSAL